MGLSERGRSPLATERRAALLLLGVAVVHVLLFLRVAVIYAPDKLLGPSGADRVFYFAYVRSLLFDHDLDFRNEVELRRPSSGLLYQLGRPVNKYPVGSPLLSLPWVAATHAVISTTARGPVNGYERAYAVAYAVGQLVLALIGVWLLFIATRELAGDDLTAAFSVAVAMLATGLLNYTAADLMMSQAASFFAISWFGVESLAVARQGHTRLTWFRLGLAAALMLMVRLQNLAYLPIGVVGAGIGLRHSHLQGAARSVLLGACGFLVGFAPQFVAWKLMFGRWLTNSYSAETKFDWMHPHLLEGWAMLWPWWPLIAVVVVGHARLAALRPHWFPIVCLTTTMFSGYLIASWWSWDILPRTAFDNLPAVSLGIAGVLVGAAPRWRIPIGCGLVGLVAWNVPLLMVEGEPSLLSWSRAVLALVGI